MIKSILASLALTLIASTATASNHCADRAKMVKLLSEKYGEVPQGVGISAPIKAVELWVSPKTGTWTIVTTSAKGVSCIVGGGSNWIANPNGMIADEPA